ncbi:MAG: hypothetical protein KBB04_12520, partial [Methanothrix sp.]|uniref:hypothetical protein n=1 Tax=Methanothrix sp. TaxID=90426 RepID=UPI001B5A04DC
RLGDTGPIIISHEEITCCYLVKSKSVLVTDISANFTAKMIRYPSGLSCLAGKGKSERFKKEEPDEPQATSNADPNRRPISVLKSDYRFLMVLFLILYHFSIFILINCS